MLEKSYRTINYIFAGIIFSVFLYSAAFGPERSNHFLPSAHKLITGEETNSTGLSRGFSSIIRLRFDQARAYNRYSIQVFLFFLIQFLLRIFFILIYPMVEKIGVQNAVIFDSIISGVMFLLFFEPFWMDLLRF